MHLTGIKLGGIPPFTDPITLRFDERVNVFIGPNASGKSTLLSVMAAFFEVLDQNVGRQVSGEHLNPYWGNDFIEEDSDEWDDHLLGFHSDWPSVEDEKPDHSRELPPVVVHFAAIRRELLDVTVNPPQDEFNETLEEMLAGPFSGYRAAWAYKLLNDEFNGTSLERLYRLSNIVEPEQILPHLLRYQLEYDKAAYWVELQRAATIANACSQQICNEVIRDPKPHTYIHPHPQGGNISLLIEYPFMGISSIDVQDSPGTDEQGGQAGSPLWEDGDPESIYIGHLSSGTAGVLLWIRWLSLKMAYYYNFEEGWQNKPAILLIDEIENHLHPTWQRRVIPALLEHFPGLQIFATTHSPFVVAGLKAGQVHVLKRDENGVVTASTEQRDVVGWTMDEILRGMMGVDEPTDQLTVDRANRLRQLRDKESLTPDEETELNQLRRQVNEDLLNKRGPLEAQRERYADLVQDFLRLRQDELNQDGE